MPQATPWVATVMTAGLLACAGAAEACAQNSSETVPATRPSIDLATGWTQIKEGEAEGTIEQDAKHPASTSPHLLRIVVTKSATPGKGRAGAINSQSVDVHSGQWCDVSFSATTERGSIGLVFSLESAEGKVLARTTLPEIGRGGRGRGTAGAEATTWRKYTVSLNPRASDAHAHLVITPIEPTNVCLDGLTLTPRPAAQQPLGK